MNIVLIDYPEFGGDFFLNEDENSLTSENRW